MGRQTAFANNEVVTAK